MTDSGPTTVGSIIGQVKLDVTQWLADKAKVKEDAREIGALHPEVKVGANVAEAIAKLDGAVMATDRVVAARRRLDTAERQAANAASTAYIANERLEAVMTRRGRTGLQVATATEALARADRNAEAAETRLIAANEALAKAERDARQEAVKLAAAQVAGAGATDAATAATIRANEANKTSVTRMGLITGAIAILVPLLIPIAGLAIGIAGALTLMGVAGVLAVFGIKKEMSDGTAVGNAYSRGLGALKKDFSELSRTSAVNMLSSFNRVVGETNAALPMLNRQVGLFSGLLGRSGANLFSGTIQGARVLEPLLLTVGVYLEGLTKKFQNWTGNGGLERFGNWAISVLPRAEQAIGSLAAAVMHLLVALEPLGIIGLAVLTGITDAINATPVEVLGALIGAILWGTLAFKAWGFIAPMLAGIATQMGAVGAATTIATGPIGWVVAGVAALAAVLTVSVMATQRATVAVGEYTTAIEADSGAIGENTRLRAVRALQESGALAAAEKMGISTRLLTAATLGEADARKQLAKELVAAGEKVGFATANQMDLTKAQQAYADGMVIVTEAVDLNSEAIKKSVDGHRLEGEALGQTTDAQSRAESQIAETTQKLRLQSDVANVLRQAFDLLNGVSLDVYSAQTSLASANNSLKDSFASNGHEVDGNTKAAVANQQAIQAQVQSAQQLAAAVQKQTGSNEAATESYKASKAAIEDQLRAQGDLTPAVQEYIDKLYSIANLKLPATPIDIDAAHALETIALVKRMMDELRRPVSISVTGSSTIGRGLQAFAGGGTVRGPGSSKSDSVMIMASDGEEVTPEPQATKYRTFLKAIAADNLTALSLPAGLVKSPSTSRGTASGPSTAPSVSGGEGKIVNHQWNIRQNASPTAVAYEVTRRLNALRP